MLDLQRSVECVLLPSEYGFQHHLCTRWWVVLLQDASLPRSAGGVVSVGEAGLRREGDCCLQVCLLQFD